MTRIGTGIVAVLFVLAGRLAAGATDDSISAGVAALYVGETRVVEGLVVAAERDANVVKLQVGSRPPHLTVSLVIGLLSNFPPEPETFYLNKKIRVAGVIDNFRQQLGITVRDPDHIALADAAPVASAAGGGQPALDLQERYDVLNERVRSLEKRLRELEPPPAGASEEKKDE